MMRAKIANAEDYWSLFEHILKFQKSMDQKEEHLDPKQKAKLLEDKESCLKDPKQQPRKRLRKEEDEEGGLIEFIEMKKKKWYSDTQSWQF